MSESKDKHTASTNYYVQVYIPPAKINFLIKPDEASDCTNMKICCTFDFQMGRLDDTT